MFLFYFFLWLDSPIWAWASSFRRGFTITHFRHTTVGRAKNSITGRLSPTQSIEQTLVSGNISGPSDKIAN
jgi:hypothetical protein